MLDILDKLDKLEIIKNPDEWNFLRELRNELTHDYDDIADLAVERINNLYLKKDTLISYLDKIIHYLENKYEFKFS